MNRVKSQKGVTLLSLVIYMIVVTVCIGILGTVSSFFYGNIKKVRDQGRFAGEFDTFNSYFLEDVKSHTDAVVTQKSISFLEGETYVYNEMDKGIYRGNVKIAKEVVGFTATQRKVTINSVDKNIISIHIIIGNTNSGVFNQTIDYVLRYW